MTLSRVLTLAVVATTACNPYDPTLGPEPFLCGVEEPRCPSGYVCAEDPIGADVCVAAGSLDAAPGDAGLVDCSSDTPEPFVVPIPGLGDSFTLAGAAICGADRDTFQLQVDTTGKNARVDVTYDSQLGVVDLSLVLQNSTGATLRVGTPIGADPDTLRADFANLAAGAYFAVVEGATGGEQVHYDVAFLVTASPLP